MPPPREVPAYPDPTREAPHPAGTAALTLSGAHADAHGRDRGCGFTRREGKDQGATWAIDSDDLAFSIAIHDDAAWDQPTPVLNVRKPTRASYMYRPGTRTVKVAKDLTVAEIDADLKSMDGGAVVHVLGTMTCPAR